MDQEWAKWTSGPGMDQGLSLSGPEMDQRFQSRFSLRKKSGPKPSLILVHFSIFEPRFRKRNVEGGGGPEVKNGPRID